MALDELHRIDTNWIATARMDVDGKEMFLVGLVFETEKSGKDTIRALIELYESCLKVQSMFG